jgi:ATP-dependent Lon protease
VLQLLKLPDGTVKVLVEGHARAHHRILDNDQFFEARAEYLTEMPGDTAAIEALLRTVADEFERYAKVRKNIPEEALAAVAEPPSRPSWPTWWRASGHRGRRSRSCSRRWR